MDVSSVCLSSPPYSTISSGFTTSMKSVLAVCGILLLCGHSLGHDDGDFDDFPAPFTPLELQNLADAIQRKMGRGRLFVLLCNE